MFNIKNLKIENGSYKIINSELDDRLDDLSKINIFVGPNNSGKSRFMRSLFYIDKRTKLNFLPNDECYDYFLNQSKKFKEFINNPDSRVSSDKERQAFISINKELNDIEYFVESETPYSSLIRIHKDASRSGVGYGTPLYYCNEIFKNYFEKINFDDNLFKYNFYKIYIPSLRGLIPLIPEEFLQSDNFHNDFYAERIKQDYFGKKSDILIDVNDFLLSEEADTRNAIITGLQFYEYVKNYLLGDLEQREIIRDYENYLSETFFENEKVALIPKVNDDVLTVRIGDEEHKIYDLGEGIQSIILITLPLFLYLEKSKEVNTTVLVFIEEPEVGLHPRLQRILIQTLLDDRFKNYQFFFTTHSNHFIDMTLEDEYISVYLIEKIFEDEESSPKFSINKIDFESNLALESLGVLPSSLLTTNCKIFVEGSYDIPHYFAYLNLYQDYLKEQDHNSKIYVRDVHYKFLRGGGKKELSKSISELSNVEKERTFSIWDFDNDDEKEEYESKFQRWGYENYYILDVVEVENLISKEILLKILNAMPKIHELGINEDFDESEFQQSNFREFLIEKIILGDVSEEFYSENYLKKRFSKMEKGFLNSYEDLSESAKRIAKKLYDFIDENND